MPNKLLTLTTALCLALSCSTAALTVHADAPVYTLGDINADSLCNAADAAEILIESAALGAGEESHFTTEQKTAADLDGNGSLNAADAAAELIFASDAGAGSRLTISDYVYQLRLPVALAEIPEFSGEPYVVLHDGTPYFQVDDYDVSASFEYFSQLDSLGRCQVCVANVGTDLMPTEPRENISEIKPTGWNSIRYEGIVEGGSLYNRCHLIAFQLTGENANALNLITGTRYFNAVGMLPFEESVGDYVRATGNHVLYRVTPMFAGDDLVARGVLMEAYSVEDAGAGVNFCVYCYNVHPGIALDYATGESWLDGTVEPVVTPDTPSEQTPTQPDPEMENSLFYDPGIGVTYVCNKNTHKFHLPNCPSVVDIKEKNRLDVSNSRDEIIGCGYVGCKQCNP